MILAAERDLILANIVLAESAAGEILPPEDIAACKAASSRVSI